MIITPTRLPAGGWKAPRAASGSPDVFTPSQAEVRPPTRQEILRQVLQGESSLQELRVDWRQNVGGRLLSQAGVGPDGSLAFVNDERLVVLAPDGSQRMSVPQGQPDWFNIFQPPVVHEHGVVAAGKRGLSSFDAEGNLRWHKEIGEMSRPPAVGPDGTIFAAAGEAMHAFSPEGHELWSTSLRPNLLALYREERTRWAAGVEQQLAEDPSKEYLVPLRESARKELADPDFGKDLQVKFEGGPTLGPDGKLYCFTQVGPLFCLDQKTGELRWTQPDKRNYLSGGELTLCPDGELVGVTGNSLLRVLGPEGEVRFDYGSFLGQRLDRVTPEEADQARRSGNMGVCGRPALSPDASTIYWAGLDGKLRAIDRQGNPRFTLELPHREGYAGTTDLSVGSGGTLYCANSRGLTALSPGGDELWRYETDEKYAYSTLVGDKVILNTYSGGVFQLDCQSLKERAASAENVAEPPASVAVANGWVTVGGVRVKQRGEFPT